MTRYDSWHAAESERLADALEAHDPDAIVRDRHGIPRPVGGFTREDLDYWEEFTVEHATLQRTAARFMADAADALERHGVGTVADLPPLVRARLDMDELVIVSMIEDLGPIDPDLSVTDGHLTVRVPR